MSNNRKTAKRFIFTVEGETEKWYLERLKELINDSEKALNQVSFKITVEKDPLSYAKGVSERGKIKIIHLCDVESEDNRYQK